MSVRRERVMREGEGNIRIDSQIRLEDLPTLNQLFVDTYGPAYPDRISAETLRNPDIRRFVVRNKEGQVIGYTGGVYFSEDNLFTLGGTIIAEEQRGRGIGRQLVEVQLADAERFEPELILADPVMNHDAMQHIRGDQGFSFFGINPIQFPGILPKKLGTQPESVAVAVKPKKGHGRVSVPIHVPYRLREALQIIDEANKDIADGFDIRFVSEREAFNCALVIPLGVAMEHVFENSAGKSADIVSIPGNWDLSKDEIQEYLDQGYLFCGVLPNYTDTFDIRTGQRPRVDLVRLWRPQPGQIIDWDKLCAHPRLAALKDWMKEDYQRSRQIRIYT